MLSFALKQVNLRFVARPEKSSTGQARLVPINEACAAFLLQIQNFLNVRDARFSLACLLAMFNLGSPGFASVIPGDSPLLWAAVVIQSLCARA